MSNDNKMRIVSAETGEEYDGAVDVDVDDVLARLRSRWGAFDWTVKDGADLNTRFVGPGAGVVLAVEFFASKLWAALVVGDECVLWVEQGRTHGDAIDAFNALHTIDWMWRQSVKHVEDLAVALREEVLE